MIALSAVIITYNEAANIARCITSLKAVADEIIMVDSNSTDGTYEIAAGMGARIIQHPFSGYGAQKDFAQKQAANDWVLNLDADEELSPELRTAILAMKAQPEADAYTFNRLNNYCGQWIKHGGWYPDVQLRLWNRNKGHMNADLVHEGWIPNKDAGIKKLPGDLLHYPYATLPDHIRKIEKYSELGARMAAQKGKNYSIIKTMLVPLWVFLSGYILKLGFLDGFYGFVIAKNSAYAAFAKYSKTRRYNKMRKQGIAF